jgi:hypothetical protein
VNKILYLDVDGVLLGKDDPDDTKIVLAHHAREFLEYCIKHFDCFWLTTHCRDGLAQNVISYLIPYIDDKTLLLIKAIRPVKWNVSKTEAIDLASDFYWIDDSLLAYEIEQLKKKNVLDRWIKIDARKQPDDLTRALAILRNKAVAS